MEKIIDLIRMWLLIDQTPRFFFEVVGVGVFIFAVGRGIIAYDAIDKMIKKNSMYKMEGLNATYPIDNYLYNHINSDRPTLAGLFKEGGILLGSAACVLWFIGSHILAAFSFLIQA